MAKIIPVILCGGSGTRLWPISREDNPKPLLNIFEGKNLLQMTIETIIESLAPEKIIIAINNVNYDQIKLILKSFSRIDFYLIIEPVSKNTAPSIAYVSHYTKQIFAENDLLAIFPADHLIRNTEELKSLINSAIQLALKNNIVIFGIKPTFPSSSFGYIHFEKNKILGFYEKPDPEIANSFFISGKYFWNAGIFFFKILTFLEELKKYSPLIYNQTYKAVKKLKSFKENNIYSIFLNLDLIQDIENISIDYAILERSKLLSLVPSHNLGWSDIGTWSSLMNIYNADDNDNVLNSNCITLQTNSSFISCGSKFVIAIGLSNVLIIDTDDALLVMSKSAENILKKAVEKLKIKNPKLTKISRQVFREWGSYTVLNDSNGYKIKKLEVLPGKSLSLQSHKERSEHWVVVQGSALVIIENESFEINFNESIFIPINFKHKLSNTKNELLIIIETQVGSYLEEDDIIRYD